MRIINVTSNTDAYVSIRDLNLKPRAAGTIDVDILIVSELKSLRNLSMANDIIISGSDFDYVVEKIATISGEGTASYPSLTGNADKVLTVTSTEDGVEWTTAVTEVYVDTQDSLLQDQIDLKADAMATSQSLTLKADLISGLIPASQLPSYIDDVLNFSDLVSFPSLGEGGKIYVAENVNKTYRWGGSSYVEIGDGGVALGETSSTAYRGDNGKIAYDHSQSQGNPHNTTTSDISEGTKLFFTEPRVRQTVLTGLDTSTASPALATDQLLAAIGKLQAQINNVNPSAAIMPVNTQTGTAYTLALTDAGNCVEMNNAAANTLTIPPNSTTPYGVGTTILIRQMGVGQTTLVADSDVTVRNSHGTLKLFKQYTSVALHKRAIDEWCIEGNLAES